MDERLIELLSQNKGEFLSGEEISRVLNCSRTAVWKHIQSLKELGYTFEAVPRKGYRLIGEPDRIDPDTLRNRLSTRVLGHQLHLFTDVESTQDIAHELAGKGAPEGTLVIAERQNSGRGRMGRIWHSPRGKGIYMSMILKPEIPLPLTPQLTLLTAVALCRTIRKLAGVDAGIKWPNDLLIGGRKISGILLESSAEDERLINVVAGIGISVNLAEEDFPEELRKVATSLMMEAGRHIDREELIALFLTELEELYGLYQREGFSPIKSLWEALSVTLDRQVNVRTPKGNVEGTAVGIDDMGALMVRMSDGKTIKLYSGEVGFSAG